MIVGVAVRLRPPPLLRFGMGAVMLTGYIKAAMRQAHYEILADAGSFYGEIDGFQGLYANADALEDCRDELEQVLEEWILLRVSRQLELPVVDGQELRVP